MLYLKHALGGIGRSVSSTARIAFAQAGGAARWRKAALYAGMFLLPGGSVAVVLMLWADRRRARSNSASKTASKAAAASAKSEAAPASATGRLLCAAGCRNDA
ncbi:hypothetical protein [Paraburkholderia tropica]|uniref:Multidrug ABC transporter ATPase n=1 Tax=Paraburkholderia tropica TaxID=92647 RepID=A0ABX5MQL0_9BURK|nr:hypothetical protein [Paraburkholderia tropica]MBB2998321.1 hypothetical protein [Paraburkholderia tropica]MBB6317363.1 hypothetical protein [Paraburkholderia tropica]MDE1142665.1 hypothetical protein [Paraburkholderia tropica]PXX15241.1 hypothetical protein C7400_11031 [Paraburkholderia tropica]PZW80922.1 hypothetical protein C7399_11031 [Paraburkholderia tropica]